MQAALEADSSQLFFSSWREKVAYYGLGTVIVGAIGVGAGGAPGLRGEGEEISPRRILAMAGLEPLTDAALRRAFARTLQEAEVGADELTLAFESYEVSD